MLSYLRMPYKPDPGPGADEEKLLDFQASREVRHTVIRVITAHLQDGAAISWQGLNFDFTGADFDGGSFAQAPIPRRYSLLQRNQVLRWYGSIQPCQVLWWRSQLLSC